MLKSPTDVMPGIVKARLQQRRAQRAGSTVGARQSITLLLASVSCYGRNLPSLLHSWQH